MDISNGNIGEMFGEGKIDNKTQEKDENRIT